MIKTDTLGDRIKELLYKNNMTQKDLASKICLSETTISRYINNERIPDGATCSKIAEVLNTTADYIIGGDVEENRPDYDSVTDINTLRKNLNCLLLEQKTDKYVDSLICAIRLLDFRDEKLVLDSRFHGGEYEGNCPSCGNYIEGSIKFCNECGQKLDWNYAKIHRLLDIMKE